MKSHYLIPSVALACALAAGALAAEPAPSAVDVRSNMVEGVNPAALAIWDVGNAAIDDSGGLDPAQMNDAAWSKVQESAQTLATYAHRLAAAKTIRATGPDIVDGKIPAGVASRAQIQAMIDANPLGFRSSASDLEAEAKALASAAGKRDLKTTGELISSFDQTCQACHQNYWYLQQ